MARILIIIGLLSSLLISLGGGVPYGSPPTRYNNNYGRVGGGVFDEPYSGYGVGEGYPTYPIGYGGFGYDRSYAVRTSVPGGVYGFDGCGCDGYGKYGCHC